MCRVRPDGSHPTPADSTREAKAIGNASGRGVLTGVDTSRKPPWFPTAEELLSDKYYIWRWRVEVGERVSAASLIFAPPSDHMMFYASLQV